MPELKLTYLVVEARRFRNGLDGQELQSPGPNHFNAAFVPFLSRRLTIRVREDQSRKFNDFASEGKLAAPAFQQRR